MDFINLPDELIIPLLIDLPIRDLKHFCQVDQRIRGLCQDERLWQQRVHKDFGFYEKHRNLTWQQLYIQLGNNQIRSIDVYYQDKLIGHIILSYFDTIYQVKRSLILLTRQALNPRIVAVRFDIKIGNVSSSYDLDLNEQFSTTLVQNYRPNKTSKLWDNNFDIVITLIQFH